MCCNITITDYIGIFTGLATFGAAIATFLTVREIKRQRESSYFPEICIDTFTVRVYGEITTKNILSSKFKRINNFSDEFQKEEEPIIKYITIKLQNGGLGAAKKIKFSWDFNYTKATEIVRKLPHYDNGFADFNISHGELEEKELSIIAPLDSLPIGMPRIVWVHYLYYFSLQYLTDNKSYPKYFGDTFNELPKPELTISYTDIQNKSFTKKFIFSFSISVVTDKITPENITIIMIEVKEIV